MCESSFAELQQLPWGLLSQLVGGGAAWAWRWERFPRTFASKLAELGVPFSEPKIGDAFWHADEVHGGIARFARRTGNTARRGILLPICPVTRHDKALQFIPTCGREH